MDLLAPCRRVQSIIVKKKAWLYLLTPEKIGADFFPLCEEMFASQKIAMMQLRLKGASLREWEECLERLSPLCRKAGVLLFVNDHPELAVRFECDGAHIGLGDYDIRKARRLLGSRYLLGVSCYGSMARARYAVACGADYIAFGSFFRSFSKNKTRARPLKELMKLWRKSHVAKNVPMVTIGGMDAVRAHRMHALGADYVAVLGAIWNSPSPSQALRAF